jgi:hypothetical protein
MVGRVDAEKIKRHIEKLKSDRRASSTPYSPLKGRVEELYSFAEGSKGCGDEYITTKKLEEKLGSNIRPADYCYNTTNLDDREHKFLVRVKKGVFHFVGFKWSCVQGEFITWEIAELGRTFTVGEYRGTEFRWDFSELEDFLQEHQDSD